MIHQELGTESISSSLSTCTLLQHLDSMDSKALKETNGRSKSKRKSTSIQKQMRGTLLPTQSSRSTSRLLHEARISRSDPMVKVTSSVVAASQLSPWKSSSRYHSIIACRERQGLPSKADLNNQDKEKSPFSIFIPGINGKALCLSHLNKPSKTERSYSYEAFQQNKAQKSTELSSECHNDRIMEQHGSCWTEAKTSCLFHSKMLDRAPGIMSSYENCQKNGKIFLKKHYLNDLQSEQDNIQTVNTLHDPAFTGKPSSRKHWLETHVTLPKAKSSNSTKNISHKDSYLKESNDCSCNTVSVLKKTFRPELRCQHSVKSEIGHFIGSPSKQSRKTTIRSTVSPSVCSLPNLRECSDDLERPCASVCSARESLKYNSLMDDKFKYMMSQLRLDREKADKERRAVLKLKEDLLRGGSYDKVQKYLNKFSKESIIIVTLQHTTPTMEHTVPPLSPRGLLLKDGCNEQKLSSRSHVSKRAVKMLKSCTQKSKVSSSPEELKCSIDVWLLAGVCVDSFINWWINS